MRRIRLGLRSLRKAPFLSIAVVLSLALGIGGNTAIFSLLHHVVLSALPIPHPEQLVLLTSPGEFKHGRSSDDDSGGMNYIFNWRTFRELEKNHQAADVVGFRTFRSNIGFARQTVSGSMMLVSGDYFRVLGVEPLVGRLIEKQDDVAGAGNPAAVLAYHYATVRQTPPAVFYVPWRQDDPIHAMSFYVRSELPAGQILPEIRSVMHAIDSDVPLNDVRTLQEQVHFNLRQDEMVLRLAGAFAALATLLAVLGLYGVMAHGVARRTREIGIRMALGAAPAKICSMVMGELFWILVVGLGIGIPCALACTRLVASMLFGVASKDLTVIGGAALLLSFTAAAAAYWPAQRASRVDPLQALRHE